MMKSLHGSRLLPFLLVLSVSYLEGQSRPSATGDDQPPTEVPSFLPSTVVVPGADAQQTAAAANANADNGNANQSVSESNPAPTGDEEGYVPDQAPVTPRMSQESVDSGDLYVVHVRPLYATGIRLPGAVLAITVGAPTLLKAEHSKDVPRLIFVKPLTNAPFNTDMIVSMKSGALITIHVFSAGEKGSDAPVDFMVDFSGDNSLMRGQAGGPSLFRNHVGESSAPQGGLRRNVAPFQRAPRALGTGADARSVDAGDVKSLPYRQAAFPGGEFNAANAAAAGPVRTAQGKGVFTVPETLLEDMYQEQVSLAAPQFLDGVELSHVYPADSKATADLAVAIGRMVQNGDTMTFSFSVQNRSNRTIEIMPPHLEFTNAKPGKPSKKHPTAIAEQLTVDDYILTSTKLAPGQRVDGAIQFERPFFKYEKQILMMQVASASEVDTALLLPIPFATKFGSN